MKFLLIANNDYDGVGQHVVNLRNALDKKGHFSEIMLLSSLSSEKKNKIFAKRSFFLRALFFFFEFLKKNPNKIFSFGNSTLFYKNIEKYINSSDVILIYTFQKILSLSMLEKIFNSGKLVYFRPLDFEMATGGCHENTLRDGKACKKFKDNCNKCPQLNFLNIFNIPQKLLLKKKKIFEKFNPKIFVENTYTFNEFKSSKALENLEINKIFLGVNKNRISTLSKEEARRLLKINLKSKIITYGTFNMDAPGKGGHLVSSILKEFLNLKNQNENIKNDNKEIIFLTFGRKNSFSINITGIKWVHLGLIKSDEQLCQIYRASDTLISPAVSCNGPHTVCEALKNNLPVVSFNVGIAQDVIKDEVNGNLIPCYDMKKFAMSLLKILYFNDLKNEKDNFIDKFILNNEADILIEYIKKDLNKI